MITVERASGGDTIVYDGRHPVARFAVEANAIAFASLLEAVNATLYSNRLMSQLLENAGVKENLDSKMLEEAEEACEITQGKLNLCYSALADINFQKEAAPELLNACIVALGCIAGREEFEAEILMLQTAITKAEKIEEDAGPYLFDACSSALCCIAGEFEEQSQVMRDAISKAGKMVVSSRGRPV